MAITPLPTPPSRQDPSTFAERADNFLGQLPTFATEANTLATTVNTDKGIVEQLKIDTQGIKDAAVAARDTTLGYRNEAEGFKNVALSAATTSTDNLEVLNTSWLGAKVGDPSVDNNGDPLVVGASYFNTTLEEVRIYNGNAWQAAVGSITGEFTILREVVIASQDQTLVNLVNSYTVGINSLMVYVNGSRVLNSDYVETSPSSITFNTPLNGGDEVFVEIGVTAAGDVTPAGLVQLNAIAGLSSGNVQAAIEELNTNTQDVINDSLTTTSNTWSASKINTELSTGLGTKLNTTNPAITGSITEDVYNLVGTLIDPANGSIQYKVLSAATTFTESLADGNSVLLRLEGGATHIVTWPTSTWVTGAAPTLTAHDAIVLWKEGTTLYGSYVGTLVGA